MLNHNFYDQTQTLQSALFQAGMALQTEPVANPASALLQFQRGFAESPGWFMVQAEEFDPEPLSVTRLRKRAVWSSERIVAGLLDLMASQKLLDRVGEDYYLLDEGRAVIQEMTMRRHKILAPLIPRLPDDHLLPAKNYFRRLLDAALATGTPPGNWSLAHSMNRIPAEGAPAIHFLSQYCSDLNAWRDDCHMAALQPLGVSAYAWEALSLIWRGSMASAATIYDQLHYRGYSRSDYEMGLRDLVQRGWLHSADGVTYAITDAGHAIRTAAERQTDDYFYRPWSALKPDEAAQLQEHMTGLTNQLASLSKTAA